MSIYDFKVQDLNNQEVSLENYQNKVLLIVNTATGCGFTPQYVWLQELYEKYKDQGLEILDFPCNQFGNQAPGENSEINSFCMMRYGTTFPRFSKIDVNGKNASPLYRYLKKEKGGLLGSSIKWNFTKFLVDQNGKIIARYSPTDKQDEIEQDILKLIKK